MFWNSFLERVFKKNKCTRCHLTDDFITFNTNILFWYVTFNTGSFFYKQINKKHCSRIELLEHSCKVIGIFCREPFLKYQSNVFCPCNTNCSSCHMENRYMPNTVFCAGWEQHLFGGHRVHQALCTDNSVTSWADNNVYVQDDANFGCAGYKYFVAVWGIEPQLYHCLEIGFSIYTTAI